MRRRMVRPDMTHCALERHTSRYAQRGVALIIALILVALAAILATKLTFDGWLEQRRTLGVLASEQALHFGMGAEALAADVLGQNGQNGGRTAQNGAQTGQTTQSGQPVQSTGGAASTGQVTLAQPWAQATQPLPLTPEDNPEGEPIGTLQASLEDMEGRFNLNNLGHMAGNQPNQPNQANQPDPVPLAQFQRLLRLVGLETKWAGIARDWIDADDIPGSPDGAEDAVYTSQTPPYRTGNYPMMSPTELMNLPGFGADRYRKIAPYVTALPTATAKINICTAPSYVLRSLTENLTDSSEFPPELLTASRKAGCFPDTAAFISTAGPLPTGAAGTAPADWSTQISETSTYFRLTTRVTLGTTEFTLYSLLSLGSNGSKVTPLLRTFGTT